jgi:hypothetical protein
MAAEKAFGMFRQDGSMSLSIFLKKFNECDVLSEMKLVALFTERLD